MDSTPKKSHEIQHDTLIKMDEAGEKRSAGFFAVIGSAVVLFCIGFVLILRQANGGGDSAAAGMILMAVSVAGSIFAGIRMHKKY